MKIRGLMALVSLTISCAIVAPALAGLAPYVRLDYGGNQLRMTDGNNLIRETEAAYKAAGFPADFQTIGSAYGPSGSVGLWLLPGFRVGATYSYQRAIRHNRLHVPNQVFFAQDLDFRMAEFGGEAAVRIQRLYGLTVGGNAGVGRADMIEGYSAADPFSQFYQDARAHRTRPTYGGFIGFDQTNPDGVVGFIRAGFQYRDMGHMPSELTISDGTNTEQISGNTIWLDYSGFYLKVGAGFDLAR